MSILANSDATPRSNVPDLSVSELSMSLQRTLEDSFGRVRVRGEISGMKLAASGHLYADLKDENACLNIICWRTTVGRLKIKPEDGLDVVCTGKITTYPKSSRYQLIVDSIELAGAGALLKMLEDRKKRLAAEGLFAAERKKKLPYLPGIIGVVTSPTGSVIRDILHRLEDRFPSHVIVWPVAVQGDAAADQITAAIKGFNAMTTNRPDIIIVARGGGSLEDLMAFNEENVVRAAAESKIPLISAVGHETDTTLIDYAADLRAPTPTAAAEMAVPVRRDLLLRVMDDARRIYSIMSRATSLRQQQVHTLSAKLGNPQRLLDTKVQSLDHTAHKLGACFDKYLHRRTARVAELSAMLRHPRQVVAEAGRSLAQWDQRLLSLKSRLLQQPEQNLQRMGGLLEAFSFHNVLKRGYAVIRDENGAPLTTAAATKPGQGIEIEFQDGRRKGHLAG
ncbi:MAG: xseA [Micavibrio sp.]|nr:xseA [Micavibrio sp.]